MPSLMYQDNGGVSSIDELLESVWKLVSRVHLVDINGYAHKLKAFLNFVFQKQRNRSSVLTAVTDKEREWMHVTLSRREHRKAYPLTPNALLTGRQSDDAFVGRLAKPMHKRSSALTVQRSRRRSESSYTICQVANGARPVVSFAWMSLTQVQVWPARR